MTFSSQFNSTLSSDTVAIQSYINAVNNDSTTTQAFEMHMRGASSAAQTYVQSMNFAALSTDAYVQQAKMAEIATMAQNKSFTSVRSILNTYNTGLSEVGLSNQQFTQSVAQGNSVLGRYLANVGVGNATMRGYVGTLIAAKAATIGLRIAQTALNAAIGFGLGLVVQFVMSGIAKAFEAIKDACKSTEEKMSDLNTKFQEISSKAQETAKNFQQLKSSVADIAPRFAELSKGVDSFGNNISLTDEEYTEFLKLNNEIAEMFPELNMGFDSNGNAMLALTGSADTLEQSLLDLVEAQRKLANEEIAKQIPDQIEALKDYDELSEKTLKDYKNRLEDYKEAKDDLEQRHSQEAIDGAKKMYGDDWQSEMLLEDQNSTFSVTAQSIWGYSEEDKAAWRAMIDDFVSEDGVTIDWYKLLNSKEFQNRISGMEKYINDFEKKSKDKWKSLASYMNAWVQTDDIYNTLDDQMQKVVSQMVSNLEYGTDELDESEEIKKYIKDNILTPLQNASPEIKQAFSDMFSIGTDDKSTTEYIKKIKEKAQEIADNSDFTYDEVLKNTGFEDIIAEYEKSANSILNSLKDTYDGTDDDLKNKIYQLSPDELTKAFDYIKDYGIKTWDDCDFQNNIIHINHSLIYRPDEYTGKAGFFISTPKTKAGEREIPMFDAVRQALLTERMRQMKEGFNPTIVDGYSGFVFSNRFNGVLCPHNINRAIDRITRDYNVQESELAIKENREPFLLPHFSVHNLRHTFCTRMCENESNIKVIQEIMGHSDITTTMDVYNEATRDKKKETFGKLECKMKIS